MPPFGSDILPPTAPFADFNNTVIGFLHTRPHELIFGIPALVLLIVSAVMLVAMLRRAR